MTWQYGTIISGPDGDVLMIVRQVDEEHWRALVLRETLDSPYAPGQLVLISTAWAYTVFNEKHSMWTQPGAGVFP